MAYDYRTSKKRVYEILNSKTAITSKEVIPTNDSEFTYSNGIKSWVGAIFVDMVGSSELCEYPNEKTARIFRAFCSEIIAIMREDPNYRQIGIRGDCVYSINTVQQQDDLVRMFDTVVIINTFMNMFEKQLINSGYNPISAGIGLGCSEDLIIKAGQTGSGINDKIWIGKAVVDASRLGDTANREGVEPIAMSPLFYENVHGLLEKKNEKYREWIEPYFESGYDRFYGNVSFYHCDIVKSEFDKWVKRNV